MAGTERKQFAWDNRTHAYHVTNDARDAGCRHYWCTGWKRDARRQDRHVARARLREEEDVD